MAIRRNILIFKLLSHFIAVVEHKQLKGAAEFLGLKQSNLSREMRDLEDIVGKKLFFRTSHGIEVTPDGQKLYSKSVDCINNIPKVLDEFKSVVSHNYITVRAPSATLHFFHRYLDDFQAKHPNISCKFTTEEIVSSNALKEIDICVTYMPGSWMDTDIICSCTVPFTLVTTQKYINKYGIPSSRDELYEKHRVAVCTEYTRFDKLYQERVSKINHLDYQVSNYELLYSLLIEKDLVACVPSYMLSEARGLIPINIPDWEFKLPLQIVSLKEKVKTPHVFDICVLLADLYKRVSQSGDMEDMYVNPKYDSTENLYLK